MSLRDRSRPLVEIDCGHFGIVKARRLSAAALVDMQADFADLQGAELSSDLPKLGRFYCEVLSAAVEDPQADAEAWFSECAFDDLVTVGEQVCRAIGLIVDGEKKSATTAPAGDSSCSCAETLGNQTPADCLPDSETPKP